MFAEEKPALLPLPLEPFRFYQFGERRVHLDSCVEVEAAYYSAPPRWIGRAVQVQWNERFVRLLDPGTGQLLRENLRQSRGVHRIHDDDRSKRTPLSAELLLVRTRKAGPSIGAFCQTLLDNDGQAAAIRRIQGSKWNVRLGRHQPQGSLFFQMWPEHLKPLKCKFPRAFGKSSQLFHVESLRHFTCKIYAKWRAKPYASSFAR